MLRLLIPLLIAGLTFSACNRKTSPASAEEKKERAPLPPGVLEGWISIGANARTFTPCGSNRPVWLDANRELEEQYQSEKETYDYAPVYVLVEGNMHASRAYPYGQALTVTTILQSTAKAPDHCPPSAPAIVKGFGNEPPWSLEINRNKKTILLKTGYEQEEIPFPYSHPQQWGDEWTWYCLNKTGKSMTVKLKEKECADSMSGQKYAAQISVQFGEKLFTGCAGDKIEE
ncbi:MAG: hypothetical protein GYB31_00065 [Bacteroidetes bacterium]|nr:hypothetical protein [Bacteroidota bacterium]